jgi:hypothetical protein
MDALILFHIATQHLDDLHAEAAEQHLIRECRRPGGRHAATSGRWVGRSILRLCRAVGLCRAEQ